jgi:hypothetical protein
VLFVRDEVMVVGTVEYADMQLLLVSAAEKW